MSLNISEERLSQIEKFLTKNNSLLEEKIAEKIEENENFLYFSDTAKRVSNSCQNLTQQFQSQQSRITRNNNNLSKLEDRVNKIEKKLFSGKMIDSLKPLIAQLISDYLRILLFEEEQE